MQRINQPNMFYNAKPDIFEKARLLRENMTVQEKMLWSKLNKTQLGVRFKAQHPIDVFIVDFYCHQYKLVVEVDGEIHQFNKEYDDGRMAELEQLGLIILRFTNKEIEENINRVIGKIQKYLPLTPKGE